MMLSLRGFKRQKNDRSDGKPTGFPMEIGHVLACVPYGMIDAYALPLEKETVTDPEYPPVSIRHLYGVQPKDRPENVEKHGNSGLFD